MLFTSMDSWAEDVQAALAHIGDAHPGAPPPVLGGHSLGGGVVQYMLSHGLVGGASTSNRISGLILLGAAPLFGGGKEMMANWGKAIPSDGYPVFFSERSLLHTPAHVRASFFSDETDEETVLKWMEQCKTMEESGRVGLSIFKSLGEADKVLNALDGLGTPDRSRRVFCIAGSEDKLVTPSLVLSNASGFEDAADDIGMDREACMTTIIGGSGHHLMMDAHWEICAQAVLSWLGEPFMGPSIPYHQRAANTGKLMLTHTRSFLKYTNVACHTLPVEALEDYHPRAVNSTILLRVRAESEGLDTIFLHRDPAAALARYAAYDDKATHFPTAVIAAPPMPVPCRALETYKAAIAHTPPWKDMFNRLTA
ncbi:alpha beta hydrolase fold protein [Seiridium cupressi]